MKRKWAVLIVFAALATPDVRAKDDEGEAGFDKGVKTVRLLFKKRKWKDAKKKFAKLLEEHRDQDYVRAQLPLVRELTFECAFREKHGEPHPKDLVGGKLEAYHRQSSEVRIRYDRRALASHWIRSKDIWICPASFDGPHTMTIKGSRYPYRSSALLFFCMEEDKAILVNFGLTPEVASHRGLRPSIGELEAGRKTTLKEGKRSRAKGGEKFELSVKVKARSVHSYLGNKPMLKAPKDPKRWGQVGFTGLKRHEEVVISGRCKRWIQGLIDAEDQKRRATFKKTYREVDEMPLWLMEKGEARQSTGAVAPRTEWPVELDGTTKAIAHSVAFLIGIGQGDKALAVLHENDIVPEVVRDFLEAKAQRRRGHFKKALALFGKVRSKAPEFLEAIEGEALMFARLRETDRATAVYDELLERYPGDATLHVNWSLTLMRQGRLTEADKLVKAALGRGVSSDNLLLVARLLQKSRSGPPFGRKSEYKSRHYHIVSDIDHGICVEAARYLEQLHASLSRTLERPGKSTGDKLHKVYLFSGQAGYLSYYKDLMAVDARGSAGLYSPLLKQLLIWSQPSKKEMMRTVRHEGFHQYLDRVLPNAPRWFNEGLAVYYETATMSIARMQVGQYREDCQKTVMQHQVVPLRRFFRLDDAAFMRKAPVHYAQSWAIIQLLLRTDKEHKQLFKKLWDSYRDTPDHEEALAAVLDAAAIEALELDLKRLLRIRR